jgi:hypothetical protein
MSRTIPGFPQDDLNPYGRLPRNTSHVARLICTRYECHRCSVSVSLPTGACTDCVDDAENPLSIQDCGCLGDRALCDYCATLLDVCDMAATRQILWVDLLCMFWPGTLNVSVGGTFARPGFRNVWGAHASV